MDPSREPGGRRALERLRALAAPALILAGLALFLLLASAPAGSGWRGQRWANGQFEGAPVSETLVGEPFERDEPTEPFSAKWTGWLQVERPGRYQFMVEADDEVELLVGGVPHVRVTGRRGRTEHKATLKLTEGVVPLELRLVDYGGGKYLRIFWDELDRPHGWSPIPWPRGITWPSLELARAASRPLGESARTALFGAVLALLTLGLALGLRDLARRRGRQVLGRRELAIAGAVVLVALAARVHGLAGADIYWDEAAYLKAGMHYVRNAELGDLAPRSFRWNKEHPPVAKWLYGAVERGGGMWGAKLFAAWLQALTCLLLFAIGRRYASLTVGASAGFLLALMPYFVGHGRAVGLESPLVFFFTLSAWLLLRAFERDSWLLHAAWGLTSILGVGSRATGVWFAPIALLVCVVVLVKGGRRILPMAGAFAGAAVGVLILYAGWPWLWGEPVAQLEITYRHWAKYVPAEYLLGVRRELPAWYYGFAFLVASPSLLLALTLVWLLFATRRRALLDWLILGWLLFPFGQSASPMRQDGARYVIQAFPALALAAALGLDFAVERLGRPSLKLAAHSALGLYVAAVMLHVHPYQLDYCSEWTGGTAAVVARRWLEIPYWGEGFRELTEELGRIAPRGARFSVKPRRHDDFPAVRPDLVHAPVSSADYVLVNYFQYPVEPAGFSRVYEVRAGSGVIGAIFRRDPE